MNKLPLLVVLGGALIASPFIAAQTTWTGSVDNNFSTDGNWTNLKPGAENPGTINSGTPVISGGNVSSSSVTINGGTLSVDTDNQITYQNSSIMNVNTGGTLNLSNTGRLSIGTGSTINFNGGNLTRTGGGLIWVNTSDAQLNINDDVTFSGGTIWQRVGTVTINNATLTLGHYQYAAGSSGDPIINLQNGSAIVVSTANGGDGQFDYGTANNTNLGQINFLSGVSSITADNWDKPAEMLFDFSGSALGSYITITTGFYNETQWETKWSDGELLLNGGNTGNFADYFTVSGDTLTLTAVPEPSTYALMAGVVILLSAAYRRRKI